MSGPPLMPANFSIAAIFFPMSKPASLVLSIDSVPVVTSRSIGPCSASFDAGRAAFERRAVGQDDPHRRQHRGQFGHGHFRTVQIHLERGGFALVGVAAGKCGRRAADLDLAPVQLPRAVAQVVVQREIEFHRALGGAAVFGELQILRLHLALDVRRLAVGLQRRLEADQARQWPGRSAKDRVPARSSLSTSECRGERACGHIHRVERPRFALQLDAPAARHFGGEREREGAASGEIADFDVDVLQHQRPGVPAGLAQRETPAGDLDQLHGEIHPCLRPRVRRGREAPRPRPARRRAWRSSIPRSAD